MVNVLSIMTCKVGINAALNAANADRITILLRAHQPITFASNADYQR
jgi:hypothetical protein